MFKILKYETEFKKNEKISTGSAYNAADVDPVEVGNYKTLEDGLKALGKLKSNVRDYGNYIRVEEYVLIDEAKIDDGDEFIEMTKFNRYSVYIDGDAYAVNGKKYYYIPGSDGEDVQNIINSLDDETGKIEIMNDETYEIVFKTERE